MGHRKQKAKILHVDDCEMMRHLIKHMCEHNGAVIYSAPNTKRAYEILQDVDIEMMFVDIDLNGESGLHFVRDIRNSQQFNHIGISMLTSARDEEMLRIATSYGADDYLIKPFTFEMVNDAVKRLRSSSCFDIDWNGLTPQQARLIRTTSSTIGYAFKEASEGRRITVSQVSKGALTTLQSLEDKRLVEVLSDLKQENGQSFIHSLRMGALLSMYAIKNNYDHRILREYATAGILHDIGLTKQDGVFFNGDRWVDDKYARVHTNHVMSGYNLIKTTINKRSSIILNATREHHERFDGSGALGLKGDEISEAGKVASICDIYANLTDKTVMHRDPLTKHEAIMEIESKRRFSNDDIEMLRAIVN